MNAKNSALGHDENQILAEGEACNRHEQQRHIFFNSHTLSRGFQVYVEVIHNSGSKKWSTKSDS